MIDSFLDGESEERYVICYISHAKQQFAGQTDIKKILEINLNKIHNTTPALLDKPVFIFIDEAHFDENWAMNCKTFYDESPYIFMIFTGSLSLHLYNSGAARKLNILPVMPLKYSRHLSLKYNYLASQKPGEISHDKLSNFLECGKTTINDIINILEKIQFIFHSEAYCRAFKKSKSHRNIT